MSSPVANRHGRHARVKRPADIDTLTQPSKPSPTDSLPTPETAGKVEVPEPDDSSSGLSDPPETPETDTFLKDENPSPNSAAQESPNSEEVVMDVSRKRTIPSLQSPVRKRVKAAEPMEFELTPRGDIKLAYQSIKAINMPLRMHNGPPGEYERPYGDKESHENSMLIYWLDEQDKSYNEATQLFAKMFPEQKAVEEAIRRRHIRALQRLAKKYGVKPAHEIDGVGRNALRRGKTRAPRVSKRKSPPSDVEVTTNTADTAASVPRYQGGFTPINPGGVSKTSGHVPKYVKLQAFRAIEKAAIVVWKDLEGMSFKDIRDKLDNQFDWSLGRGTVEKFYHLSRPKIYGALNAQVTDGDNVAAEQDGEEEVEEEAVEKSAVQNNTCARV